LRDCTARGSIAFVTAGSRTIFMVPTLTLCDGGIQRLPPLMPLLLINHPVFGLALAVTYPPLADA
jgi:hypothetical protein